MKAGTIKLSGVTYPCTIDKNGIITINGMKVEDFLKTLPPEVIGDLALLGGRIVHGKIKTSATAMLNVIEHAKQKN